MHLSTLFPELFDSPPFKEFTPAEAARLTNLFPETQRLHRSRFGKAGLRPSFPSAPYEWATVLQLAVMADIASAGLSAPDAWKIASSEELRGIHECDYRNEGKAPLFVFARRKTGAWHVSTNAGTIAFDTWNQWWGNRGFWFNYSDVQRRVIAAYEQLRVIE